MELEKFIEKTLTELYDGVKNANKKIGSQSKSVMEPFVLGYNDDNTISFDVAVTVSQQAGGKIEGSINVLASGINTKLDADVQHQQVSRIKFSVRPDPNNFMR